MDNKINIAELLKDCPKGMELDCAICNGVKFMFIKLDRNPSYPIVVRANNGYEFSLTKYGQVHNIDDAKCVIFPKGKTTWEGFQRPFKDGDIASTINGKWLGIVKKSIDNACETYIAVHDGGIVYNDNVFCFERFATEEEKAKLFNAIKANGYKWNAETKTLEKLPKFKVGNKIEKCGYRFTIVEIKDNYYLTKCGNKIPIAKQDDWELVPNKFDINTLKVFDKVLVRDSNEGMWSASIFSHTWENKYICIGIWYNQCIPYEGNEHLLGTANDCDEYYKTWE